MRSPARTSARSAGLFLGVLVLSLSATACGGSDDEAGSAPSAPASTEASTATPSPSPSVTDDPQSTGLEAQSIGLDVADYAVKNNFKNPTDQADFEAKVKISKQPSPGSKVAYRPSGKSFQICVVHYDGTEPTSWGLFDGTSGKATSGAGEPTEAFCP